MSNQPLRPTSLNCNCKRDGVKSFLSFFDAVSTALTPALSKREREADQRMRSV